MINENLKGYLDVGSLVTALATLTTWLPPIAALFSIVWTGIRIYEWWKNKKIVQSQVYKE